MKNGVLAKRDIKFISRVCKALRRRSEMVKMPFENLVLLKASMREQNHMSSTFSFVYNGKKYYCIAWILDNDDEDALFKLDIMKTHDINDNLVVKADVCGLLGSAKEIRLFFELPYSEHLGNLLRSFYYSMGKSIPVVARDPQDKLEQLVLLKSSQQYTSVNDDASKIYCYKIQRSGGKRTMGNNEKARILEPKLYSHFADDWSISFYFSQNSEKHKTPEDIISVYMSRPRP